ncbi:hypothetical protein SK069_07030 [Patulibacter brassicae]|jgi:Ca2+-binding RTX toxin-like protein|uniref:Calcium-binding protein n=1 Tax=Patulibacter brassicae TaxID=1705717 RepID=A0ABU4VJ41_9ACTN|nr:hypothetical protein [Patulibacter brassicae]MDX8151337.1 hypothetical protein [Patulibacter brassicae]
MSYLLSRMHPARVLPVLLAIFAIVAGGVAIHADAKTFKGNARGNTIRGTNGNDVIYGNGGNDRLYGRGGNDTIYGGGGNDRIDAGSGRRGKPIGVLVGGAGNDTIISRNRVVDIVSCGPGRDTVVADRIDRIAGDCETVQLK